MFVVVFVMSLGDEFSGEDYEVELVGDESDDEEDLVVMLGFV